MVSCGSELSSTQQTFYDTSKVESSLSYHPKEQAEVEKVFSTFGNLYIAESPSSDWEQLRVPMPWSGYWYPLSDRSLFDSSNSPLAKLDRILNEKGIDSDIAGWERENSSGTNPVGWEGLCDAWALSSTQTPEPLESRTIEGIDLSQGDLKGIYTKLFQGYPREIYGVQYRGNADTDGTYQDLRPEAFHRLIQVFLGDRSQPLVIDEDPGIEMWSKPVYRYKWNATRESPNSLLVEGLLYMTNQRRAQTNETTSARDALVIRLNYRLIVDPGDTNVNGARAIKGQWLDESIGYHPDVVLLPDTETPFEPVNPELIRNLGHIRQLLQI